MHTLDRPTLDRLAGGKLPIEGRVDLHGMTQSEAHALLLSFLQRAHANGVRYVLVITGKGFSSGGDGVLRRQVPAWLSTPPFRVLVSSHDLAARRHGGEGALYVRLRKTLTPLGEKLRELRRKKGVSQKEMAAALGVSAAYLSALEHGRRGVPTWVMLQKIIGYFNVIWDDADEIQQLAAPVASARGDRHVRPVAGSDGARQSAGGEDRRARRADAGGDEGARGRRAKGSAGTL